MLFLELNLLYAAVALMVFCVFLLVAQPKGQSELVIVGILSVGWPVVVVIALWRTYRWYVA